MFVFHSVCHAKIKACVENGLNGLELITEWQGITSLEFKLGYLRNLKAGKSHPRFCQDHQSRKRSDAGRNERVKLNFVGFALNSRGCLLVIVLALAILLG